MSALLYFGEASGGRVLRYGAGLTNVRGTGEADYQLDLTTWDCVPATEVGDTVFRSIDASFTCTNGYAVGITPIVDGVALPEQTFSGAGSGEMQAQAWIAKRGARIAARFRTLTRNGDLVLHNLTTSFWIIRTTP